ncbi:hypothetical protein POVWA2_027630 [Plasmodium ovale wallikeri]|uniref:Secreted protein n=1 Tax=Plasmodium ovale wallikeri TaxID=864142 RepID=A0A1A8YV75_PLAOA|nr:hypothetical protein POVWA1_027470 [Plasmodium ovale wallikeri]SBT35958.1 hypothetical protein POVWA2_027630 [Plasmodium ovale wallikeri]
MLRTSLFHLLPVVVHFLVIEKYYGVVLQGYASADVLHKVRVPQAFFQQVANSAAGSGVCSVCSLCSLCSGVRETHWSSLFLGHSFVPICSRPLVRDSA